MSGVALEIDTHSHPPIPSEGPIQALALHAVILEAWRQRFCGTLCLEQGRRKQEFLFDEGSPVQVISNLKGHSLTLFLTQTGRIGDHEARLIRDEAQNNAGHEGLALMKLGLMDPPALFAAIRAQLEQCLQEGLQWNSGQYHLDPDQAPGTELAPFRLDPIPILQQSLTESSHLETLLGELQSHLSRHPAPHAQTKKIWARLQHTDGLNPVCWTPERSLSDNLTGTALSTNQSVALWLLINSGALRLMEPPRRTKASRVRAKDSDPKPSRQTAPALQEAAPSSKPGMDTLAMAFAEKLSLRLKKAESANHYALLELEDRCTATEIRRAYLKAAKLYHPDATMKYGHAALKEQASLLFSHITEAFEVLSDPDRRNEYDALLRGESTEAPAHHIAQAEIGYQKAEVLLRMGQFKEAIPYLKQAVTLVPDEEEFHATLGWALYKTPTSEPRHARESLQNAIKLKPDYALAHFRLAIVCRSLGDTKAAEAALARAKELEQAQSTSV